LPRTFQPLYLDAIRQSDGGEILVSEATNLLLLIPTVIGLVMLTRWFQGRPAFTDRDWRFLFGQPREKVFSLKLWLKFAVLWFAVVVFGFAISFYVLRYGANLVHGCAALAHRGDFSDCAEVVALT
jgi:ABC-type Fe3+ transport system permease subunit